jgi:RimJ/RimL family protein N-acetyltransferase
MQNHIIATSPRLTLRTLNIDDAPFYLELVNDPSFIHNIRDKGIRTIEQAQQAILKDHIAVQETMGFSLYCVCLRDSNEELSEASESSSTAIGLCGFVKRPELENIDLGYAFLPRFHGQGYAYEAITHILDYGKHTLHIDPLCAITSQHNHASENLLKKVGFEFQHVLELRAHDFVNYFLYQDKK